MDQRIRQLAFILLFLGGSSFQPLVNGQEFPSRGQENRYFENTLIYTDRDIYISGEKIWFKVLCNGPEGRTEDVLSKILCVEIYDQQFNSIAKGKFRITNGMATGFLGIPSSINSGYYYIRAYSQFLINYPSYLYSSSLISIINPDKPLYDSEKVISDEITIVPEGGKLIAGIASRLAVRIAPALCKKISGMAVMDNNGREVAHIMPLANGLAMFEMTPDSAVGYSLKITQFDNRIIQKSLPPVSVDGMILKSDFNGEILKISLCTGKPSDIRLPGSYKIEIRSDTYERLITKDIGPGYTVVIPADQLGSGIVYLLLKNKEDETIDIQAAFISGSPKKEIIISTNKSVYNPRESVDLSIDMQGNNINKNQSLLSVALAGTRNHKKNLLPAYITYNPVLLANYLKNTAPEGDSLQQQIDIALILYSKVFNSTDFREGIEKEAILEYLPEIRDASISGQVINKRSGKPLADVMVYAAVFEDDPQLHIFRTKADGKFYFTMNHLTGMQHIYLCPKPIDSLEVELRINADFSNTYPQSTGLIPFYLDSSDHKLLDQLYLNAQVSKAFIRHMEQSIEKPGYYPLSRTAPEYTVLLKDFIEMPVMEEVFTEITPFVLVHKKNDHFYLSVYDDKAFITLADPLVLLDGIPVFDHDQIMKISPENVEKIDVTNKVSYLGEYTIEGIISIHTKTNNFAGIAFPGASEFIEYQAITTESYPVFPDHSATAKTDRNPDFRNLLYWNPFLMPDSKSNEFRFYTSDHCGQYEIVFRSFNGFSHFYGKANFKVEGSR